MIDSLKYKLQFKILIVLIISTIIFCVLAFNYVKQKDKHIIEEIEAIELTIKTVNNLRIIAVKRLNILQYMLLSDDSFLHDELYLQHINLANDFLLIKEEFTKSFVSLKEKLLLQKFNDHLKVSSQSQEYITDLVKSQDIDLARKALGNKKIFEANNQVLLLLEKIHDYLTEKLEQAIEQTNEQIINQFGLNIVIVIIMLFGIAVFGSNLIKKLMSSEKSLRIEIREKTEAKETLLMYQERLHALIEEKSIELDKSETHYRVIFEFSPVAIISFTEEGYITSINPAAETIFNYKNSELEGKHVVSLFPEKSNISLFGDQNSHEFENNKLNEEINCQALDKGGRLFSVELLVNKVVQKDKTFFIAMLKDISERDKMQAELLQARKLESVGQLASGIAHEINTPLQYVSDNTHFLKDAFSDIARVYSVYTQQIESLSFNESSQSQSVELIKKVVDEVKAEADMDYLLTEIPVTLKETIEGLKNITHIVQAMKSFSHPGAEIKTRANVNELIQNAHIISRNEWKYHAVLDLDLEPRLKQTMVYPDLIGQTMLNLIVNASHAINDHLVENDKGLIKISSRNEESFICIEISDNGGGISDDIKEKIFDPFFTTKDVGKGTGQGLSLAYSTVVEKHQGKLSVSNNSRGGASFIIKLPLIEEDVFA